VSDASQPGWSEEQGPEPMPGAAQGAQSPQPVRISLPQRRPVVTYGLMGFTIAVYLLQLASQNLTGLDYPALLGAKINQAILQGQLWRLITPLFLHGSILHIGFNMYALYVLGPGLERHFGAGRYLALYFLGGFAGNVSSFIMSTQASIGASTAIFGLLGAEGVFVYQNRRLFGNRFRSILFNTLFIAAVNLAIGASFQGIDNWGHLGGLIGGTLYAWFAGPLWAVDGLYPNLQLVDRREKGQAFLAAVGVAVLFGVIFLIAAFQRG
jgi:rhomboid protease GluP